MTGAPTGGARWANAILRFALELAMLVGLAVGGWAIAWPLAILLPVLAAAAWGRWLAPRAARPVADPSRIALEGGLFAAGAAGWATGSEGVPAVVVALAAAAHLALTFPLAQREPPRGA